MVTVLEDDALAMIRIRYPLLSDESMLGVVLTIQSDSDVALAY